MCFVCAYSIIKKVILVIKYTSQYRRPPSCGGLVFLRFELALYLLEQWNSFGMLLPMKPDPLSEATRLPEFTDYVCLHFVTRFVCFAVNLVAKYINIAKYINTTLPHHHLTSSPHYLSTTSPLLTSHHLYLTPPYLSTTHLPTDLPKWNHVLRDVSPGTQQPQCGGNGWRQALRMCVGSVPAGCHVPAA